MELPTAVSCPFLPRSSTIHSPAEVQHSAHTLNPALAAGIEVIPHAMPWQTPCHVQPLLLLQCSLAAASHHMLPQQHCICSSLPPTQPPPAPLVPCSGLTNPAQLMYSHLAEYQKLLGSFAAHCRSRWDAAARLCCNVWKPPWAADGYPLLGNKY